MQSDPTRAIRFDPYRRAATAELKAAIGRLRAALETHEAQLGVRTRSRRGVDQRAWEAAIEALACNLLVNAMVAPERALAVPRSNAVMGAQSRYKPLVYGKHFTDLLDLMERAEVGLIRQLTTGYRFSAEAKGATTYEPTTALASLLPLGRTEWSSFTRDEEREPLVLKAPKQKASRGTKRGGGDGEEDESDHEELAIGRIDYEDTAQTRRLRKQVQSINAALMAADVTLDMTAVCEPIDENGTFIDPTRRCLTRVFNNGDWRHGGRLFGGFWMSMRRRDRFAAIRIKGERIAEVDYGQLFPRLAYAKADAPPPPGDLYGAEDDPMRRKGLKKLLNALLFTNGKLTHWPKDTSCFFGESAKLRDVIADIESRHAPVAHLFGSRVGFELMWTESNMAVEMLPILARNKRPALPLHDAFITAASDAEFTKDLMASTFKLYTGVEGVVEIKWGEAD